MRLRSPVKAAFAMLAMLSMSLVGCRETAPPTAEPALTVEITGLPSGALASVTVESNDWTRTISQTTSFTDLAPGVYFISADSVLAPATRYPAATRQVVELTPGSKPVVKVRYGSLPVTGPFVPELEL